MQSFLHNRPNVAHAASKTFSQDQVFPKFQPKDKVQTECITQSIPVVAKKIEAEGAHAPKIDVVFQDGKISEIQVKCTCGMEIVMGV